MKNSLLALCLALLLTSCAGVRVTHTDVATGATNPRAIYIRPFDISDSTWTGHQRGGQSAILQSLAPAVFAEDLKEELEKLAPAMVLKPSDYPTTGWLVEGSFDLVDAGNPSLRSASFNCSPIGASHIQVHIRILDLGAHSGVVVDSKDVGAGAQTQPVKTRQGVVIYEFDLAGGSHLTGMFGSTTAPGLGYAPPFDYRNAAERVYEALDPDEFNYGLRDSPTIR